MRKIGMPKASARGGLGRRLYLGVGGLGLFSSALVIGLIAWQAVRERGDFIEREKDSLSRLAQVVAAETSDMFARIRLYFDAADLWLAENPESDPRTDPGFERLTEAFRASVDHRIDIRLVSAAGQLYYVPSSQAAADVSDRDYFKAQSSPGTRGFYVGAPIQSRVSSVWGIPVSFPLTSQNAGISVIFAAIELPDLDTLYEAIRPKPRGSVALMRSDSVLLARAPYAESILGQTMAYPDLDSWERALDAADAGVWITRTARSDNEERIVAYRTIPSPELVVSVSARLDDVLAGWKASLWWRTLIAALILVAIGSASFRLLSVLGRLDAAQDELRGNLERLRQSDATKDKLFSVIAHDLRGPIGGMSSLLETLSTDRGDMNPETVGEFIGALRIASWNTYQLLENLLAWSRSKRGEIRFNPSRVLILPLLRECEEVYDLSIADKGLSVDVEVEPALEARADPDLLKVVLRNLISNAVKFTRRGGRISISAAREPGGTRITVRDEGIGMGREELDALFDLGATKSRSGTANERGSGLGLVLSKEIVDLHGGKIEAESENGAGSRLSIILPDEPGGAAQGSPA